VARFSDMLVGELLKAGMEALARDQAVVIVIALIVFWEYGCLPRLGGLI
jgi:hypothetical protein